MGFRHGMVSAQGLEIKRHVPELAEFAADFGISADMFKAERAMQPDGSVVGHRVPPKAR